MSYWVIARVSGTIPQLFSAVLGFPNGMVTARATAGARMSDGGGCVITLNPRPRRHQHERQHEPDHRMRRVQELQLILGAISIVGGGTITTTGGAKTNIVGNWSGSGNIRPSPVTGAALDQRSAVAIWPAYGRRLHGHERTRSTWDRMIPGRSALACTAAASI